MTEVSYNLDSLGISQELLQNPNLYLIRSLTIFHISVYLFDISLRFPSSINEVQFVYINKQRFYIINKMIYIASIILQTFCTIENLFDISMFSMFTLFLSIGFFEIQNLRFFDINFTGF